MCFFGKFSTSFLQFPPWYTPSYIKEGVWQEEIQKRGDGNTEKAHIKREIWPLVMTNWSWKTFIVYRDSFKKRKGVYWNNSASLKRSWANIVLKYIINLNIIELFSLINFNQVEFQAWSLRKYGNEISDFILYTNAPEFLKSNPDLISIEIKKWQVKCGRLMKHSHYSIDVQLILR